MIRDYAVPRDEYREVLSRLDGLEKDVALIKEEVARSRAEAREDRDLMRTEFREDLGAIRSEFRKDLEAVRSEFREELGELRRDMNERFDEVGARFDELNYRMVVQTRWFIGALTVLVTVISALMAIAQFGP